MVFGAKQGIRRHRGEFCPVLAAYSPHLQWHGTCFDGSTMIPSKRLFTLVPLVCAVFLVSGCSHQKLDQKLNERLEVETNIKSSNDLSIEAVSLIEAAPNLTAEQRTRLLSLQQVLRKQLNVMRDQSLRLQAVLLIDLVDPQYRTEEVELIEDRLKDVESKKVAAILNTVEQANTILGHESLQHQRVLQALLNESRSGRED